MRGGGMVDVVGRRGTAGRGGTAGREVVERGGDLAAEKEIGYSNATRKGKGRAAARIVSPPENT